MYDFLYDIIKTKSNRNYYLSIRKSKILFNYFKIDFLVHVAR